MAQARRTAAVEKSTPEIREHYPEFVRMLEKRRDEILGRATEERRNLDEQVMSSPGDAADESVIDTSADYFLKLANTHQHELIEIREALDRMHRGVYGTCESCENPIAIERLRRLPYARLCLNCKTAQEKRETAARLRNIPKL